MLLNSAGLSPLVLAENDSVNLISNGDFARISDGAPADWNTWAGKGTLHSASADGDAPKGSAHAVRITAENGAEGNISTPLASDATGKKIIIRGKVKQSGLDNATIVIGSFDSNYSPKQWTTIAEIRPGEWTSFEGTAVVSTDGTIHQLMLSLKGNGTAWLADVTVTAAPGQSGDAGAAPSLVSNLDLLDPTNGHPLPWATWSKTGVLTATVTTEEKPADAPRSLQLTATAFTDGNAAIDLLPAAVGKRITIHGEAKETGFDFVGIAVSGLDESYAAKQWSVVSEVKSDQWKAFEATVLVDPAAIHHQIVFQVKGKGTAWLANLHVTLADVDTQQPSPALKAETPAATPPLTALAQGEPVTGGGPTLGQPAIPISGTPLISAHPFDTVNLVNLGDASATRFTHASVSGQPFSDALRIEVTKQPQLPYHIQTQFFFEHAVKKGDVILACLAARGHGTEGRQPRIEMALGQYGEPWLTFATIGTSPTENWNWYYIKAICPQDYPEGKARLTLNLGFPPQTIEIGGVQVVNYGSGYDFASLPITHLTYVGREMSAPWRAAANARIEKYRKGDLVIHVADTTGRAVSGASVQVHQLKPGFPFGVAVSAPEIAQDHSPDGDRYRQTFLSNWSYATIEFDTVWGCWETWPGPAGEHNHWIATEAIDWLDQHQIGIHGCHLIWGARDMVPTDVAKLTDPVQMHDRMAQHTRDILSAYRGKVNEWNAVNEAVKQSFMWETMGEKAIVDEFAIAHEADPKVKLGINDYGDFASWDVAHIDAYVAMIKRLKDAGARIDVIGLQGHCGSTVRSPQEVYDIVERFAQFGIPIHVSELDINASDEQFQADYLRDLHIILFSHPAVERITQWGFWEGSHWLPSAALWRRDWSIKPAGQAWRNLVFHDWMTDETVITDSAGNAKVRGFCGPYTVRTQVDHKELINTVTLTTSGATLKFP